MTEKHRGPGSVPLKPKAGLYGHLSVKLDPDAAAERSGRVIGFRAIVIKENGTEAAIAKKGAAEFSDIGRRLHPARGFGVELSEFLQFAILLFRQKLDAHRRCHFFGVPLRFILFS